MNKVRYVLIKRFSEYIPIGEIMVEKISRFKFDAAFQPYLVKVLNRLPADVKEKILNDKTLQLISSRSVIEIAGIVGY